MKTISVLGSTGSIGTQSLDVARKHNIRVNALAALNNVSLLSRQILEFKPECACIYNEEKLDELKKLVGHTDTKLLTGMEGLLEISRLESTDILLNSVVGMVGLLPTLEAIKNKKDIALANKETLVAGGELVMKLAKENGVNIFPVDSEHSAIFQCLQGNKKSQVKKIILTASGGPFFGKTKKELENVTLSDALAHPNWSMGKKITVDSATLMNKGLEFIEAMWLFDLKPEQIEVVVHRESVIHSAVEYMDNSVIAQLGVPDMKIPIQYALLYPERVECEVKELSLIDYGTLTFFKPDYDTFTCLNSCIEAVKIGGTMPAVVNGANEAAVERYLNGEISFIDIGRLVNEALRKIKPKKIETVSDILASDKEAREFIYNK